MIEASSRFNVMVETKLRATATVLDVELDRLNSVFVRMHELPQIVQASIRTPSGSDLDRP